MSNDLAIEFKVRTGYLNQFQAEFSKLAKKAAKLGIQAPEYQVTKTSIVPAVIKYGEVTEQGYEVTHITVTGQAPKLAGWVFIATLQHEEAGNIVRRVPGTETIAAKVPLDLRSAAPYCDHCEVTRKRTDTYVVANETGKFAQVGRNCLKDFTGHDSPEAIARWAEFLGSFEDNCRDFESEGSGSEGSGGRAEQALTLLNYLCCVALAIRETGEWLSRTKARDFGRQSTSDVAWSFAFPMPTHRKEYTDRGLPFPTPNDDDKIRAQRAIDTALSHFDANEGTELSDYEHNLRIVVECNSVAPRSAGIAASLIQFSERLIGQAMERKRATDVPSAYQGTVGKRETFRLTVLKVISLESQYGITSLHLMQDSNGNSFKWAASSDALDVGTTYDVVGSVKKHEEYKGKQQTTLTRCKAKKI